MAPEAVETFAALFRGRTDALGVDIGGVRRDRVTLLQYRRHLEGEEAVGIFPTLDDNTVWFGAIDLDEPNFELARKLQSLIPGQSWIERSRSGNAHVWVFFERPAPAWAVRAILRSATQAVGRPDVEVFPKQDQLREGMVGNYINLPLFGDERPILLHRPGAGGTLVGHTHTDECYAPRPLEATLDILQRSRQDPELWVKRARLLGAKPPIEREATSEWGTSATLHRCADYIIKHREDNPLARGHRHVVLFNLAKMLLNWREMTQREARRWVDIVNAAAEAPVSSSEIDRLFTNAVEGRWTSTSCDEPVMQPYVDPDCPIARGTLGG